VDLLDLLRSRSSDPATATDDGAGIPDFAPLPPVAPDTVQFVEGVLGFALPPLLVQIYTQVANGGIGPGYGLFRMHHPPRTGDLAESYQYMKGTDPKWKWPDRLLPVFSHGCGMYECVDCTRAEAPVIWHNPDYLRGRSVASTLAPLAPSLQTRLEAWLRGENLLGAANEHLKEQANKPRRPGARGK